MDILNFHFIEFAEHDKELKIEFAEHETLLVCTEIKSCEGRTDFYYGKVKKLQDWCTKNSIDKEKYIIGINWHKSNSQERYEENLNSLINLLSRLNKEGLTEIIVIGLTESDISHIDNSINETKSEKVTLWDENLCVLFYIKHKAQAKQKDVSYYTPLFHFGKSNNEIEFNYPNNLDAEIKEASSNMLKHLHSLRGKILYSTSTDADEEAQQVTPFDKSNYKLRRFDTIIKVDEETIFDKYVKVCLEQEILKDNNYKTPEKRLPAFKISNLHTKIGKNIHLADFYYDSKMFQNSFFSDRFASEIVRRLLEQNIEKGKVLKGKKYKIIGYAKYSELLVSEITILLNKTFKAHENVALGIPSFSYSIFDFDDDDDDDDANNTDFIVVVPSSITFQTMKKVCSAISKKNKVACKITALNISNESGDNLAKDTDVNFSIIETSRIWYRHYGTECKLCFPDEIPQSERPLIEIKKKYKTPIIFNNEFPFSGSRLEKYPIEKDIAIRCSYYNYGYTRTGNSEHIHYIESHIFFKEHYPEIVAWLKDVRQNIKNSINPNRRICLVALEGNYNNDFAQLINEIVFKNRAIVIHHNTKNDFIENSKGFYKDIVATSDMYYVDDLMLTGRTFISFNNFIRQIWYDWDIERRPFRGVFALVVRSYDFAINQVARELSKDGKIHVLKQLRVPPLYTYENVPSPLRQREILYEDIAKKCNLDRLKAIFLNKSLQIRRKKLITGNIDFYADIKEEEKKDFDSIVIKGLTCDTNEEEIAGVIKTLKSKIEYRLLCKLLITDIVFGINPKDFDRIFDNENRLSFLLDYIIDSIEKQNKENNNDDILPLANTFSRTEWKEMIIKVISVPPFIYYANIQSSLMKWMIEESEAVILKLTNEGSDDKIDVFTRHYLYRYLKLLFRRLAYFKSTYLLRKETLSKTLTIYTINEEKKNEWDEYKKIKETAIQKLNSLIGNNIENYAFVIEVLKGWTRDFDLKKITINNTIQGIIGDESTVENTLRYYCQVFLNCNNIFNLLHDSPSFITSCIKEVIHEDNVKAEYLAQNIKEVEDENKEQIESSSGYKQLLLFVKIENANILKLENDKHIIKIRELIPDTSQNNIKRNRIPENITPDDILNEVLREINKIVSKDDNIAQDESSIDILLTIKNNPAPRAPLYNFGLIKDEFYNPSHSIDNIPNTLISNMFEGIEDSACHLQTFTLFRLVYDDDKNVNEAVTENKTVIEKKFESFLDPLKIKNKESGDLETYDLNTLNIYREAGYTLLLCFRIGIIDKKEDEEATRDKSLDDNSIENPNEADFRHTTQAVIFIGVKQKSEMTQQFLTPLTLTRLACVKERFSNFLKRSIENDVFDAYQGALDKSIAISLSEHGTPMYIKALENALERKNEIGEKKLMLLSILANQVAKLNYIRYNLSEDTDLIDNNELYYYIQEIRDIVIENTDIVGKMFQKVNVSILESTKDFQFEMHKDVLIIFFAELFVNIKKHNVDSKIPVNVIIDVLEEDNIMYLKVESDICGILETERKEVKTLQRKKTKKEKLRTKKTYKDLSHGLSMIKYYYDKIYGNTDFRFGKVPEKNKYCVKLPLLKYNRI